MDRGCTKPVLHYQPVGGIKNLKIILMNAKTNPIMNPIAGHKGDESD